MNDYHQPDFYRFNEDSLFLVSWITAKFTSATSVLDLAAGCGIIGIELSRALKPKSLALVELQADYLPFIQRNVKEFLGPKVRCEVSISSFGEWKPQQKYDVIVCNPPYYLPGRGQSPKDARKALARSFNHEGWTELLNCMELSLGENGVAFIVIKNDVTIINHIKKELGSVKLSATLNEKQSLVVIELTRLNKN